MSQGWTSVKLIVGSVYTFIAHLCVFFKSCFTAALLKIFNTMLSFLESPDTEAAMDLGASEAMESEVLYDCVICGQSGPSTEDRPFGLVVLLQASSGSLCARILSPGSETLNLNSTNV